MKDGGIFRGHTQGAEIDQKRGTAGQHEQGHQPHIAIDQNAGDGVGLARRVKVREEDHFDEVAPCQAQRDDHATQFRRHPRLAKGTR